MDAAKVDDLGPRSLPEISIEKSRQISDRGRKILLDRFGDQEEIAPVNPPASNR